MNSFLRRVLELRNLEQMASIGPMPRPACSECGKEMKPGAHRDICWACRNKKPSTVEVDSECV